MITGWLSIAASVLVAVMIAAAKVLLKREQRAKDRAEVAEQSARDLKAFAGKNLEREEGHVKRVEKILSGVARADAGRMLSGYPTPRKLPKVK